MYDPEKSQISLKNQQIKILKMKLSLQSSRDLSLVSEDIPVYAPTALQFGHRRDSSFHVSQKRWHDLVVRHAKRAQELGSNPSSVTDWLCDLG